MATCDMGYEHEAARPDEAEAAVDAVDIEANAEVKVAEIEAERDVTLAKIAAKVEEAHDETEIEALRAEIKGIKETLDRIAPPTVDAPEEAPPAPPVVVAQDVEQPEVEAPPEAEKHEAPKPKKSRGLGVW